MMALAIHQHSVAQEKTLQSSLTFTVKVAMGSGKARVSHYLRFTTSLSFIKAGTSLD